MTATLVIAAPDPVRGDTARMTATLVIAGLTRNPSPGSNGTPAVASSLYADGTNLKSYFAS